MATKMARLMVSIPQEIKSEIETVKRNEYYNKSYAELYRQLIHLGLEKMRESNLEKCCGLHT